MNEEDRARFREKLETMKRELTVMDESSRDAALARIDRDEYGLCPSCEEEIDPRRLEFNPAIRFCVTCAGGRR